MMLLFMKEATIAVLPATYQSERDATKDYAFLSLNSNIGNTLGYLGWTTSVSVGNTMALTGYAPICHHEWLRQAKSPRKGRKHLL